MRHLQWFWLMALGACSGTGVSVPAPVSLDGARTWYGAVGPLVASRCAVCHRAGDIAPFPLETLDQVRPMLPSMRAAVADQRMPPFPPEQSAASGCPPIDDLRQMSEAERAFLLAWIDDGAPAGEPRDLPPPKPNKPLGDPTDTWPMPEYASKQTSGDDYRCFLVQPQHAAAIPVAAVSVIPGNRAIVHHSAVYLIPPDQLDAVKRLDAADDGPGYTCFGGVGVELAYPTGLWVPGNDAPLVPPKPSVGYYLPPGWGFVVQNHYNLSGGSGTDRSAIALWRGSFVVAEVPRAGIFGDMGFVLPPGQHTTVETGGPVAARSAPAQYYNGTNEGRIYAVWGHMHLLGQALEMDLVHPDGSEQCLLRIPRWDFHWQSIYRLKDLVAAKAGDRIRVRCHYDNPGSHEVRYGEGTADEMCFATVSMLEP